MEVLKKKHAAVTQALITLYEALEVLHDPTYEKVYENLRDSAIQRFEYSIDMLWKFLKLYLQEKQSISLDIATPRAILRNVLDAGIINKEEYQVLISSLADRNLTSHSYNKELAEELIKKIPGYYTVMKAIADKTK